MQSTISKIKTSLSKFNQKNARNALNHVYVNPSGIFVTDLESLVNIKDSHGLEVGLYEISKLGEFSVKSPMSVDEYPTQIVSDIKTFKTIEKTVISIKGLKSLNVHSSKDESRPHINSVYFHSNQVVATNGYHLKHIELNDTLENNYLVPRECLENLFKLLKCFKLTGSLILEFNEDFFRVTNENFTFIGRLLKREYIRYQAVIPKKCNHSFVVERLPEFKNIKPHLNRQEAISLKAIDNEVFYCIKDSDIKIKIGSSDHDFEIWFNAKYLNVCFEENSNVTVKYNNNLSPVKINENVILMPLKIN